VSRELPMVGRGMLMRCTRLYSLRHFRVLLSPSRLAEFA
jgi:hypothetical protein